MKRDKNHGGGYRGTPAGTGWSGRKTVLEVDAFVFHAQHDLALGSGFGGAISVRGGPSVQKALEELGPLETGEAVITDAGKLKADYIIHAVGPRFREPDIEELLRKTVLSALACAKEKDVKRIAFPALGAGYYGVPPALTARVMVDTIRGYLEKEPGIEEIVICVFDTPQFDAFQAVLTAQGVDRFPDLPAAVIEMQALGIEPNAMARQHFRQPHERQRFAVHQRSVAVEQDTFDLPR